MPNFHNFTSKAKEAIRKAHELAIERGQNHVGTTHLLTALAIQEESVVIAILDRLDIDIIAFTDLLLEALETPEVQNTISQSYQLYLTPELAKALEYSAVYAEQLGDTYVGVEHLFVALLENPGPAIDTLQRTGLQKDRVRSTIKELRESNVTDAQSPKKFRTLSKYTRNLTKLAQENKIDPVIGRDVEIQRVIQILSPYQKQSSTYR